MLIINQTVERFFLSAQKQYLCCVLRGVVSGWVHWRGTTWQVGHEDAANGREPRGLDQWKETPQRQLMNSIFTKTTLNISLPLNQHIQGMHSFSSSVLRLEYTTRLLKSEQLLKTRHHTLTNFINGDKGKLGIIHYVSEDHTLPDFKVVPITTNSQKRAPCC